jgi:hypothetical protein
MSDSGKQEDKPMGENQPEIDHDREHDEEQELGTEMSATEEVC